MSTNAELASLFDEMAAVLELTGANPFRANAHARVARVLRDLTIDVAELASNGKQLTEVEGIGAGSARRIQEYLTTGRIREHDELLARVPRGLLEVLQIPGLGPKTVRVLWEQAGVQDVQSLKDRLEAGALEGLPRMGAKTIENIRSSIAFTESAGARITLGAALPMAEAVVSRLRDVPGVQQLQYAGSLRRGAETIGDIDVLAATARPDALTEAFTSMPDVTRVLVAGHTKCSVRLRTGVQVDLRVVEPDAFGAALLYFTGSKQHNVRLRERAIKAGRRLNEYGLFEAEGGTRLAGRTEEEVFAALELPWIPPELREDRGELGLTATPRLIDLDDVGAELHAHTVASDGRFTIDELAAEAKRRGLHTVAVTDHSKSSAQAGGLSPETLGAHIAEVREANERIKGITILAGSEVDILADGHLDYDDDLLAELDLVVASPHTALRQEPDVATQRLLRAVRHPLVHVLGHATGRLIGRRDGLHPDVEAIVAAAAECNTALELNANPARLDLRDVHVKAAVDAGALVAINTDAHSAEHFDYLRYGVLTARRGWLAPDGCITAWPRQKLLRWLKSKR